MDLGRGTCPARRTYNEATGMLLRTLWVTLAIALAWSQGGNSFAQCACSLEKSSCGMQASECCCPTNPKPTCKLTHLVFHQDGMLSAGVSVPVLDVLGLDPKPAYVDLPDTQGEFHRFQERPRIRLPAKTPPDLRSPPSLS
jgi:hypothetical protein